MKAMVYTKYGTSEVLKLREVEKPTPKDNEVLIKVQAASINSWDWDLLRGKPFLVRLGGLLKPQYKILGADMAGRIEAVGKNVKGFHPGDEVFGDISGCGWGAFAEYVCAHENALTRKPFSMTFEEAAALPQAATLAIQGIRQQGPIQSGQKILINGAGGGVGTIALQIAKLYGAKVTSVDKTEKLDMLKSLGSEQVIDYTQEDFIQRGQYYDLILDVVGNRSIFDYKRALKPKGTYVMIGGSLTRILQLMLLGPVFTIMGKKMAILIHKPNQNDQTLITEFFESAKVKPVIDRCYPLSEVPEAFQYFGEGNVKGKIVIRVDDKNTK